MRRGISAILILALTTSLSACLPPTGAPTASPTVVPTLTQVLTPTISPSASPTPSPLLILPDEAFGFATIGTLGYTLISAAKGTQVGTDTPVVDIMALSDGRIIHFTYRFDERRVSSVVASLRIEGSPEVLPTPDASPVHDMRIDRGTISFEIGTSVNAEALLSSLGTPMSDKTVVQDGIPGKFCERTLIYSDMTVVLGQDVNPTDSDVWFLQSASVNAASCVTARGLVVGMTPTEALGRFATGAFVVDPNFESLSAGEVVVYITLTYPGGANLAPAWTAGDGGISMEFSKGQLVRYWIYFASGAD